ncbi:copper chaperone [Desulfonema ishimotonii]|uniref:Copper chaperone n=1 Tax=Desulfonema ishimotonii TaxID=45657 RepID=A0A401FUF6_9BACT|nr:heavy-metal-associated domain-containing protein [Desulfonema ishimotonii]GBC60599.1 copper chaperone [Desulfonema ishimotonii]
MEKKTFNISNISCGHCTSAIENELSELPGVSGVRGDIESKSVTVEWEAPATLDQILATLKEINYPPAA